MNILFISFQPYPFGMAGSKRVRLFAENLAINNDVKVLVIGKSNGGNVSQGELNNVSYKLFSLSRVQRLTGRSKVSEMLKSEYKAGAKNVMIIYDGIGLMNFIFAKKGRKLGYKIVADIVEDYNVHQENTGMLLGLLHRVNALFEKNISNLADGVVVISNRLRNKFEKLGVKPERIERITICAENIDLTQKETSQNKTSYTFLYSGSYANRDGIDLVINAFKKLSQKRQNVVLVLGGKINDTIKEMIKIEASIKYVGMVSDNEYYGFLNSADALLVTRVNSDYANAGFPFKLGEYLATGKPVIISPVSDIRDYLIDREDVIMTDIANEDSLIKDMEYIIDNPVEAAKIGQSGLNKCKQYFNPKTNSEKLEVFLNKICASD
jgi:glycosyltransferase involved in cell wall biosynthesis